MIERKVIKIKQAIKKTRKRKSRQRVVRTKTKPIPVDIKKKRKYSETLPTFVQYRSGMSTYEKDKWLRTALIYFRAFIAEGLSDIEIRDRLNINEKVYDRLQESLMEQEALRETKKSTPHRFYEFTLQMEQCIRDLDYFIEHYGLNEPTGIISAAKAKSSILKDIIKTGQDLGIVEKRASEHRILGELNLAVMDNDQLAQLLQDRFNRFCSIVQMPTLKTEKNDAFQNMLTKSLNPKEEIIDAVFEEK